MTLFRSLSLDKLNSLTKYPSIPTFHAMGQKGRLTPEAVPFDGPVIATEKVDGTNTRVLVAPDGSYVVGSREELLHHRGDLCWNPSQGIVSALRDLLAQFLPGSGEALQVWFGETYGGKIGRNASQYTVDRARTGFRVFDLLRIDWRELEQMMAWELRQIAGWRDAGGQTFVAEGDLETSVAAADFELTPRLARLDNLPEGIGEMNDLLRRLLPQTLVALDAEARGVPEGIVFRAPDRSVIAKARYEDYRRTLE